MARKFIDIEGLTQDWVAVSEAEDPNEWRAWKDYRREILGCSFIPKNFTVPSPYPPIDAAGQKAYAEAVAQIRKANGWVSTAATASLK